MRISTIALAALAPLTGSALAQNAPPSEAPSFAAPASGRVQHRLRDRFQAARQANAPASPGSTVIRR